ncbi:MAG: LPS export ABC transporter permease LptG [Paracoccaceae bacterium]|jgi:lipopolysaccharide export system permease protein
MRLSFYIARRFLATFALVGGGFFVILWLLDLVDQIRRFPDKGLSDLVGLALLHTPGTVYRILPLLMVMTAIALFLRLARTSELVAIRASGRSALRTLLAPVGAAFAIGVFAVALLNPIVAATTKRYELLTGGPIVSAEAAIDGGSGGLWLRQAAADGQWVIRAGGASEDDRVLSNVSFLLFGADGRPKTRLLAAEAQLEEGRWIARDVKVWDLAGSDNPEAAVRHQAELAIKSDLTLDQIRDSVGAPETVSVWDLPGFIARLDAAGFSSRRHTVALQGELTLPLLLAAMVLVGAGFTMRHARFGQSGLMVLMALVSGIAIFFVRNFAQVLGESGQLPVLLAAWTPPLAALLLSLSLLLHLEDG